MQRVILRPSRPILTQISAYALRLYSSAPVPKPTPGPTKPYEHQKAPAREQSWLTRKLKQSPTAMRAFLRVFGAMGYGSSRQIAARRALALYEQLCAGRAEEDRQFWAEGTHDFFGLPSSTPPSLPLNETGDDTFFWDNRVSPPSNVSVLVHRDKPPRMDAHDAPACAPRAPRASPHPRTHRPLLPGRRGPHPTSPSTTLRARTAGYHDSHIPSPTRGVLLRHTRPLTSTKQEARPRTGGARFEADEDIP